MLCLFVSKCQICIFTWIDQAVIMGRTKQSGGL